jgi:dTDP-4-dehydrorhamnose reductase
MNLVCGLTCILFMKNESESLPLHLEMWAGLECTVNRVGDGYLDQMERNGHATRVEDIARFADLGIKKMRYPILWERIAPEGVEKADWSWADERLELLQAFGIQPIVGLVHHGCGPIHTSLVKPCFVTGMAEYARAFAERYPWVEYYTPVNEPLTTARFSGLYGHWYPHGKDGATFARALLIQCRATVECMKVIREVNPAAKLVLTEDLGKTYSTPLLAYQADLENERRWLSMDLLTGQLRSDRPMWEYLIQFGIEPAELQWFLDHPCPPDIVGINHYPTSERYLDENTALYPEWSHGGNEYHKYADVDAIRVQPQQANDYYQGHYNLLKETWERYGLPMAVTEVHLCGPREQQMAWLQNVWNTALRLRNKGVDVRAVTAWSLLGTFDWINLVTRDEGHYESGVFDVRGPHPRPTALAKLVSHLAHGSYFHHPLREVSAWWQRTDRFLYPLPTNTTAKVNQKQHPLQPVKEPFVTGNLLKGESGENKSRLRPVLIVGGSTHLGKAFARICRQRHLPCLVLSWYDVATRSTQDIEKLLEELHPWAVVNAASYGSPSSTEENDFNWWANTYVPYLLSSVCQAHQISFLTFSSDWVFDGLKGSPYVESDPVSPLNKYGRIQAQLESRVLKVNPSALAVRTGTFIDPDSEKDPLTVTLRHLAAENKIALSGARVFSPAYLPDLVHGSLDLLVDGERGVWHLVNQGATTWLELVEKMAISMGMDTRLLYGASEKRSGQEKLRYTVLDSERGLVLPDFADALVRYGREVKI